MNSRGGGGDNGREGAHDTVVCAAVRARGLQPCTPASITSPLAPQPASRDMPGAAL
jgi:hypothetical protein